MTDKMLKAALWYRSHMGYSVIPVDHDKKPLIKWQKYQTEKPSVEQITEWWSNKFAGANIGIVTGSISNLTVIDIDSAAGLQAIEEITPENMITPIATSPSGGQHRYFQYYEGLGNSVRFITDCDIRSEGGYIIAPPSQNGRGNYTWINGLSIANTDLSIIPSAYIHACIYSESNCSRLDTIDNRKAANKTQQTQQNTTNTTPLFSQGSRDQNLFHLANCLVKGGMPAEEIKQYLTFIARRCDPPFPEKEIFIKIQSAIKRGNVIEKGLTESVRDLITQHRGNINTTQVLHWVTNDNKVQDRKKIQVIMGRLCKEGRLKPTGRKAAEYYIVSQDHEIQDWKNANTEEATLTLPLGMHEAVKLVPGSLIIFSGVTNTGKTAFCMNIARLNCHNGTVRYLTSEIEQDEFRNRVDAYCQNNNDNVDHWDVELIAKFNPRVLPDLINPTGLNIIDYLEPPNGDYTQIVPLITDIHHVLKGGICIIAIQKKDNDQYGSGGQFVRNKSHLFCTLDIFDYPVCECKIMKCKAPKYGYKNPVNLKVQYQINVKDGLTIRPFGKFDFKRWDI